MLLTAKTYPNFVRIDQFLKDIYTQTNILTERKTIFILTHDNKISSGTLMKRRISPQKIYKNLINRTKVIVKYTNSLEKNSRQKYLRKYFKNSL